ncbi:MAG TPA: class II aldolase/adducin family protein [Bacteroidota bacterium]|nr:class II aldolase/adducin family protein [Bacteroidota bacterium]
MKESKQKTIRALLSLSHELGREERGMAILGEGNTSARIDDGRFLIKASGSRLSDLRSTDVVECKSEVLLSFLEGSSRTDAEIESALFASRVSARSKKPSVEALFHAFFLTLDGIQFVGHTHAIAVNKILCSPRAREFAEKRIFPDEIVCCGPSSVFVPYTDPGFSLARHIRMLTMEFLKNYGQPPRVILMQNHGIITLGRTPEAVLAAMFMAEKTAQIWTGAAALGGPTFLSQEDVDRIANRIDEHYRQRVLKL